LIIVFGLCISFSLFARQRERNLTIKETSQKTGIRPQYLQKIEAGLAYKVMVEKHLVPLAKVFKIKFHELFEFK